MTYKGKVTKGTVVLPPDANIPEGTEVEVTPVQEMTTDHDDLTETLKQIASKIHGLPPDLARNHDHYLYGAPKR